VSVFLVVAHIAMIFGMLNPEIIAASGTDGTAPMHMDSMGG
jgi:hypothetical protein